MWTIIARLIGGPLVTGLLDAYRAKLSAKNTQDAQAVDLAKAEILGEISARQTEASIIRTEQGWWFTALPRPLFALAVVIYFWKILVWDKVLGLGSTTLPAPEIMQWCGIIITAYFGGRSLEKIARIFKR